jgi:uncharacterized membrane protein HdeD (DUF308 family)
MLSGETAITSVFEAQMRERSAVEPPRTKSGWVVALGVVYVIVALIGQSSAVAKMLTVFVVGVMMLILGIPEVIYALQFKSGQFPALAGPWPFIHLYIVAGLVTLEKPAGPPLELGGKRILGRGW